MKKSQNQYINDIYSTQSRILIDIFLNNYKLLKFTSKLELFYLYHIYFE